MSNAIPYSISEYPGFTGKAWIKLLPSVIDSGFSALLSPYPPIHVFGEGEEVGGMSAGLF